MRGSAARPLDAIDGRKDLINPEVDI